LGFTPLSSSSTRPRLSTSHSQAALQKSKNFLNNSEHSSAKSFKQKQLPKQSETGTAGFVQQRKLVHLQEYRFNPFTAICRIVTEIVTGDNFEQFSKSSVPKKQPQI
jgi:hypothetical protein